MAEQVLVDSTKNGVADTIESFYSSPDGGGGTRITSFSASNNTVSSKTYKAYLFNQSGTGPIEAVVPQKIVVRDRFDLGPSITGQLIPPGGSLRMESSDANSISFRVTGNEL